MFTFAIQPRRRRRPNTHTHTQRAEHTLSTQRAQLHTPHGTARRNGRYVAPENPSPESGREIPHNHPKHTYPKLCEPAHPANIDDIAGRAHASMPGGRSDHCAITVPFALATPHPQRMSGCDATVSMITRPTARDHATLIRHYFFSGAIIYLSFRWRLCVGCFCCWRCHIVNTATLYEAAFRPINTLLSISAPQNRLIIVCVRFFC